MSFGLSMHSVNYVQTYTEARAMHERAPPRRGTGSGDRALPGRAKSKVTGISLRLADVVFTYHRTNVVIWRPNGDCVLDLSWASRSTAEFANRFTPTGVNVTGEAQIIFLGSWSDGTFYRVGSHVTITPDGALTGTIPFRVRTINRKRAKQALVDAAYPAFAEWYKVQLQFWEGNLHRGPYRGNHELLDLIRYPDRWSDILQGNFFYRLASPAMFLTKLREKIYTDDVYDMREEPHAPSYNTARKWMRG
jgi:hypothetical protein